MARGFAWVLNFDADDELARSTSPRSSYTPGRSVLARFASLTAEVAPTLLGPGDYVLMPVQPEVRGQPAGKALGRPVGEARGMEGRAFCPTPRARAALAAAGAIVPDAPPFEVLRRVNHRRFAADLGQTLPGARFVTTLAELLEVVALPSPTGHWLLKRPWSFAGRARRKVRAGALEEAARPWVLASLARVASPRAAGASAWEGGLQVEPWVERAGDFAQHGFIARDAVLTLGEPTTQRLDASGAWCATALASPEELSEEEREALGRSTTEAARALATAGYFGPFGVDAFRYLDARGVRRFNARCEINARYSMGWATGMGTLRPDREPS